MGSNPTLSALFCNSQVKRTATGIEGGRKFRAATSNAAAALGFDDLGVVRSGAVADLLVLDGNPLDELEILLDRNRIHLVLQAGEPVVERGAKVSV